MKKVVIVLLAMLMVCGSEARSDDSLAYQQLKSLEVFVGDWEGSSRLPEDTPDSDKLGKVAGKEILIRSNISWVPGKCALIQNSTYEIKEVKTIKGTAIWAWDQAQQHICTHTFTTHKRNLGRQMDKAR